MTTGEVFPGFVFRREDDEVQGAWDPVNGIHSVRGGRQLRIKQDGPGVGSRQSRLEGWARLTGTSCREAERERLWLRGHVLLRSARQPGAARAQECASIRTSLTPSRVAHASREAHGSLLDGRATRRQGWQTRPQSPLRFAFKTLHDVTLLYSLSCFSIAKVTYVHLKFYPIHRKF